MGDDLSAKDGAKISQHVYQSDNSQLPNHIQEITDEVTLNQYGLNNKDLMNDKIGFKSGLYINTETGEVTYAIAGTDGLDAQDIVTNAFQGMGFTTDSYQQGIDNAVKFDEATQEQGVRASLTGHSMGGGIAAAASEKTGLEAKTYNAAGVHPVTVVFGEGTENIDNYVMRHDPLTNVQNFHPLLPDASGTQHMLNPLGNKSTSQNIKEGHSIDTIIEFSDIKDEE